MSEILSEDELREMENDTCYSKNPDLENLECPECDREKRIVAHIRSLQAERDKYRAILEGNEYELNAGQGVLSGSVEACRELGREAARRTKEIIAERDALKAELAGLDKDRARLLEDLDFHRKWLAGLLKKDQP